MKRQQSVLITGASSGIGKELAIIFAKHNYNVILVARREHLLESLAKELTQQYSIQATVIAQDLSQPGAARIIYDTLQEKNIRVDVLVNNAGFGVHGHFSKADLQESLNMVTVNVGLLTELTHLFLPAMISQKYGKILNIASTVAFQAGPNMAVYSATKAYVLSFSEALSSELKNSGVTVTALCPGATTTEFHVRANMSHAKIMKSKFTVMDAKSVATIGFYSLLLGRSIVVCGILNKLFAFSTRFAPRRLATKIAGYLMR